MNKKTANSIIKHYSTLYENFGYNPASIGWPKGKQNIRFHAISQIGNLNNSKILDVGCGFGDLATFLKFRKIKMKYTGVDINEKFIKIAETVNPDCVFEVRDIEKRKFKQKFDWIFAIGTTNQSGSYQYIENLLNEMFRISKKGISMDFLSSYVDFKRHGNFHASPERIFKIAKKLSKRVVIRHDYLPFEFCVYIYKNNKIKKDLSFMDF